MKTGKQYTAFPNPGDPHHMAIRLIDSGYEAALDELADKYGGERDNSDILTCLFPGPDSAVDFYLKVDLKRAQISGTTFQVGRIAMRYMYPPREKE